MTTPEIFQEIVECECSRRAHCMFLEHDSEFGLSVSFQPTQHQSFLSRCWVALKFVFGVRRGYSFWDSVLINETTAKKFQDWLDRGKQQGYGTFWV